ncbi:MAG TPA: hypothetical protein VMV18_14000 [bacterium]|nr:hypothetical protein [bacterium]
MEKIRSVVAVSLIIAGAFAAGCVVRANAAERQPHMDAALHHLEAAKAELEAAEADKGGHRVKALEATNLAISETREGIRFANQH